MLIRNSQVAPQQEYYSDSLLKRPGIVHSVFDNLASGVIAPALGLQGIAGTLSSNPNREALQNAMQSTELENETPGTSWTQYGLNTAANMIGMGLNPATWVGGGAGGLIARGVTNVAERAAPTAFSVLARQPLAEALGKPLGQFLPRTIGTGVEEKTLSAGLVGQKTLETFGTFAGATIPQAAFDNYNNDSKSINWGGVARESGLMGAFGIAIGSIPFTYGVLKAKINRGVGVEASEAMTPEKLNEALEKQQITPDEHQWYNDYLAHKANPKEDPSMTAMLQEQATKILKNNDYEPDAARHEMQFDILKNTDIENLKGAAADQLVADVPESHKSALSDFITHSRLDEIRSDPTKLDGVKGYVEFINEKLGAKSERLAEADRLVDKHLMTNMKENMPFSQKELVKTMKKSGFLSKNVDRLPIVIPDLVKRSLRKLNQLSVVKKALNLARRRGEETDQLAIKVTKLESELPSVASPKEELRAIRKNLITDKGLKKNWERSKDYHRLMDLTNTWANARTLADRVHLEAQYEKQEAFRDLAEHVTKLSDSDAARLSKPDQIMDYLKQRLERNIFKEEPIKSAEKIVKAEQNIPADADAQLSQQELQSKNSNAENAAKEFDVASERFKEFKGNENVFKNLISCVLGALNV